MLVPWVQLVLPVEHFVASNRYRQRQAVPMRVEWGLERPIHFHLHWQRVLRQRHYCRPSYLLVVHRRKQLLELVDCPLQTNCLRVHLSELVVVHQSMHLQVQRQLQPEPELPIRDCLLPVACFVVVQC
jgi:hypothetical protein